MVNNITINVTDSGAFILQQNLNAENWLGATLLIMIWMIGFFIALKFGFKRAIAYPTLSITPLAIGLRFWCGVANNGITYCMLSDTYMWMVIILAAIFGALLYFTQDN